MSVSVIIPAFNVAKTISRTIESLISQTYTNWQAIVIDDGSDDNTSEIVKSFRTKCSKIIFKTQENQGEAAARNVALKYVDKRWLLFLDSDDWIKSDHLEKLTKFLDENNEYDAVICKVARVTKDGTTYTDDFFPTQNDLFPLLAKHPVFPIHACLIKSSIVEEVGGFDKSFITCPDWDLWQRIARKGCTFGLLPETLSFYNIRPHSASNNGEQLLKDGLRVIERGHTSDPRVSNPLMKYENGLDDISSKHQKIYQLCWCAGLLLGSATEPSFLIQYLKNEFPCPDLDRNEFAKAIYNSCILPLAVHPSQWISIWPGIENNLDSFLYNMDSISGAWGFARHTKDSIIRLILEKCNYESPVYIGSKVGITLNITESIEDIVIKQNYNELFLKLTINDDFIGSVEIPVFNGRVSAEMIKDSISSEYSWIILRIYYENNIYKELNFAENEGKFNVEKKEETLYEAISLDTNNIIIDFHNQYGWEFFIKELFNQLINNTKESNITKVLYINSLNHNELKLDIIDGLNDIPIEKENLKVKVVVKLAGIYLGFFNQDTEEGYLKAKDIYTNIVQKIGYELCRIAVREGLIGRKFNKSFSLISKLRNMAKHRSATQSRKIEYKLPEDNINADEKVYFYPDKIESNQRLEILMQIKTKHRKSLFRNLITDLFRHGRIKTTDLPILMYHSIFPEASPDIKRYVMHLEEFEKQIEYLYKSGFYTIEFDDWYNAKYAKIPLPGKAIIITFDDGYTNFRSNINRAFIITFF